MKIIDAALIIAQIAGKHILKSSKEHFTIEKKGINDLVTNVDKEAEKIIIDRIKKVFPDHAILAEESEHEHASNHESLIKAPYIWIIDPIDGTSNFAHGLKEYCVSIGVFQNKSGKKSANFDYLEGELIAGVIYAPALKEIFHAEKGKGAFLNGNPIKVSKTKDLEDSFLATGFPRENREEIFPYFAAMLMNSQSIRRLGSAALDLAYVAAGRFDGFWELHLKPWDIAAGALILSEAGGKITDFAGNTLDLFGQEVLATNKKLHKPMSELLCEAAACDCDEC